MPQRRLGEYTLDVSRDDRGRVVAEVWHTESGKTLAITEVDSPSDALPWAEKAIELATGVKP